MFAKSVTTLYNPHWLTRFDSARGIDLSRSLNCLVTMPEETQQEIPADSDKKFEKQVNMMAYPAEEMASTDSVLREWVAEVTHDKGVTEQNTSVRKKIKGSVDITGDNTPQHFRMNVPKYVDAEDYEDILGVFADGRIELEEETSTNRYYSTGLRDAARDTRGHVFDLAPPELTGGLTKDFDAAGKKWQAPELHEWKVSLGVPEFTTARVLSKEEKREDDDLYETIADWPCFSMQVTMEAPTEELIDAWTEDVIPDLHSSLAKMPEVGKVRYMDCTVTKEEEGECYNL